MIAKQNIAPQMQAGQMSLALMDRTGEVARLMRVITVLAVMLVVMVIGMAAMGVMIKPEVRYVEFATKGDYRFSILPSPLPPSQLASYRRTVLRQYVRNRELIDHATEESRFSMVIAYSTTQLMHALQQQYQAQQKERAQLIRDVEIITDVSLGEGIHQVEFKTLDRKRHAAWDSTPFEKYWIATLKYVYANPELTTEQALQNPFGVYVVDYVVMQRQVNEPQFKPQEQEVEEDKPTTS